MQRHVRDHVLWILCVDDETFNILGKLRLPNVRLLQLSRLETEDLLRVKPGRSVGEYCWTLTPFAIRFVFERDPTITRVTYVDADLWFRKDPAPIFQELDASGKAVLITDHGYAPEHDQSETSGQYCVQFMTFDRLHGESVRQWWQDRCVEWCFARFEDGKFGDQKYLDIWPIRFRGTVHVLQDKELALAPWNASRFPYGQSIFYHFHGLRIASTDLIRIGNYPLPEVVITYVYKPYLRDLRFAAQTLFGVGFNLPTQAEILPEAGRTHRLYQALWRLYWSLMTPAPPKQISWNA